MKIRTMKMIIMSVVMIFTRFLVDTRWVSTVQVLLMTMTVIMMMTMIMMPMVMMPIANDDDDDANGDDGCHPGVQSSCKVRLLTFSTLEC